MLNGDTLTYKETCMIRNLVDTNRLMNLNCFLMVDSRTVKVQAEWDTV